MIETKVKKAKKPKPRRTRGTGGVFLRGTIWWIKYKSGGQTHVESSGSTRKSDADQLVLDRVGDSRRGLAVTPKMGRLTLKEGLDGVVTHYQLKERASVESVRGRIANHILAWTGWRAETPMATIDSQKVQAYALHRREEQAAPATINRELAIIRLAFSLAVKSRLLAMKPHVEMLTENNVRKGFFEDAEFRAVVEHLPAELRGMFTLAYYSGWRVKSEIVPLEWSQVDRTTKVIRLDVGTTKNREGRTLPYGSLPELVTVVDDAWKLHQRLAAAGTICPLVFPKADGESWRDNFYDAWDDATKAAGCPGRIPHDLRRTAVRNLVRRGVSEKIAMSVSGHKTRSVFDRYDIVNEQDIAAAMGKLSGQPAADGKRKGQVRAFRRK